MVRICRRVPIKAGVDGVRCIRWRRCGGGCRWIFHGVCRARRRRTASTRRVRGGGSRSAGFDRGGSFVFDGGHHEAAAHALAAVLEAAADALEGGGVGELVDGSALGGMATEEQAHARRAGVVEAQGDDGRFARA